MDVTIRISINGREYPLRVRAGDEGFTREIADLVDQRVRDAGRQAPGQPDLTHTVIAALALGEELLAARQELDELRSALLDMVQLTDRLDAALSENRGDGADVSARAAMTSSAGAEASREASGTTSHADADSNEGPPANRLPEEPGGDA